MSYLDEAIFQGVTEVATAVDRITADRACPTDQGQASGFGLRTMPRKRYSSGFSSWHSDLGRRDRADWSNTF